MKVRFQFLIGRFATRREAVLDSAFFCKASQNLRLGQTTPLERRKVGLDLSIVKLRVRHTAQARQAAVANLNRLYTKARRMQRTRGPVRSRQKQGWPRADDARGASLRLRGSPPSSRIKSCSAIPLIKRRVFTLHPIAFCRYTNANPCGAGMDDFLIALPSRYYMEKRCELLVL